MKFNKTLGSAVGATLSVLGATAANATTAIATPDVTSIADAVTGIGVVGAAVFGVFVLVKGFHWVRRAL